MTIADLQADAQVVPIDSAQVLIQEARVHRRMRNLVTAVAGCVLIALGVGLWVGLSGTSGSTSPLGRTTGPGTAAVSAAAKAAYAACSSTFTGGGTNNHVVATYPTTVGLLERANWQDPGRPADGLPSRYARYPQTLKLAVCVIQSPRGGFTWPPGCPARLAPGPTSTQKARLASWLTASESCRLRSVPGARRFMQTIAVSASYQKRISTHGDTLPGIYAHDAKLPLTPPPTAT
jgi:hypothetical protein